LTTRNFAGRNFKWSTDFNLTLPNNKLTAYPDIESSSYVSKYAIGRSLNRIFAAQFLGVDPTTGLYTVKDVNGDGKLTSADFGESGITSPQFYGGLNNSFSYKRFSASFFLQFTKQLGKDWRGANTTQLPGTIYNFPTLAMNRWREEGQITDVQKYTTVVGDINGLTRTYPYILSGGAYTDASFIRLKNVYVSYDLPSKWLHVVRFSSCKFYTQAQNLFVLSGYKGGDPETQSYMRMAPLRTITGGLQLTF
jgi:hypothetical protein